MGGYLCGSLVRGDVAYFSADGNARHADDRLAGSTPLLPWWHWLRRMLKPLMSVKEVAAGLVVGFWLLVPTAASAHNGPPFPIIENRKVGPCMGALWTHPDVGSGAFYVFLQPAPGGTVPNDLKIRIGVQPITGRLPETFYEAQRVKSRGQVQYNAQHQFDQQALWRVRPGGAECARGRRGYRPSGSDSAWVRPVGPLVFSFAVPLRGLLVVSGYRPREAAPERSTTEDESSS